MRVSAILVVMGLVRTAWANEPEDPAPAVPDVVEPVAYPERFIDRPLVLPAKMLASQPAMPPRMIQLQMPMCDLRVSQYAKPAA